MPASSTPGPLVPLHGFDHVLVLGAGTGNDIVSAAFLAHFLTTRCGVPRASVAGLLSAQCQYFFAGRPAEPLNRVEHVTCYPNRLFTLAPFEGPAPAPPAADSTAGPGSGLGIESESESESESEPCVEAVLAGQLATPPYAISPFFGTVAVARAIEATIHPDVVLVLDVGGDALFSGSARDIRTVISPLEDAFSLALGHALAVPTFFGLLGPGTDLELVHEGLHATIEALRARAAILETYTFTPATVPYLESLYEVIQSVREGKTIPLFLRSVHAPERVTRAQFAEFEAYFGQFLLVEWAAAADLNPLARPVASLAGTHLLWDALCAQFDPVKLYLDL